MDIDHILIFTDHNGKIADDLVAFGLTEGGSRVHEGQGTTNRTFVFENFYLEIVWVHNKQEITRDNVLPTGLWTRANYKLNDSSPFGLCIDNTYQTDELFRNAFKYQPDYFPKGMTIDILNNSKNLCLPLTVRLPFQRNGQKQAEPLIHKNGIGTLTKAVFQFTEVNDSSFLEAFASETIIQFAQGDKIWLTLTFDKGNRGLTKEFEELRLTINY